MAGPSGSSTNTPLTAEQQLEAVRKQLADLTLENKNLTTEKDNLQVQVNAQPMTSDAVLQRLAEVLTGRRDEDDRPAKIKVAEPKDFDGKRENAEHYLN